MEAILSIWDWGIVTRTKVLSIGKVEFHAESLWESRLHFKKGRRMLTLTAGIARR
jgi:hypothetical protein